MHPVKVAVLVTCAVAAAAAPTQAQQDTSRHPMTLRITSTVPGREVAFKAAFWVDPSAGLRYVEARTPFEVNGVTSWAIALVENPLGGSELRAELLVTGTNGDRSTVSTASGPRLIVEFNAMRQRLAQARDLLRH
jgi:hypothetical protein